jgi:hypothetical protein
MTALVNVREDEITIELSGSTALPMLRRTVRIPLLAIRSVSTNPPTDNPGLSVLAKIAGSSTAARSGSVVHEGRHLLLAYTPGDSTMTLELNRVRFPTVEYDAVVRASIRRQPSQSSPST